MGLPDICSYLPIGMRINCRGGGGKGAEIWAEHLQPDGKSGAKQAFYGVEVMGGSYSVQTFY